MLVTLYKIHKVYFHLLGTSGFYVKAEVKNSLLLAVVVLRTWNMKISHRHLADFIKELLVTVAVPLFCHFLNSVIKEIKNAPSALLSYISVWEFLRTWEKHLCIWSYALTCTYPANLVSRHTVKQAELKQVLFFHCFFEGLSLLMS